MSDLPSCPDPDSLRRLASGRLSAEECEALLAHLETCPACSTIVAGWNESDTLAELLREARQLAATPPEAPVAELIARLSQARPEPTTPPSADPEVTADTAPRPAPPTGERYPFLAPAQAADELGRIGPYRVLEVIGTGGMGVVFRAEDPHLQRPVALKVMLPVLAANENARNRFLREARACAAIRHDHIVAVYQVGESNGDPYLAMEFLEGESLDTRLHRAGKLPVAEVIRIGREMALGLAAAHKRGLIHRDIKPANVWLEAETGRVKILDFGLARAFGQDTPVTLLGAVVGTPAYMAPEQAQGQVLDQRADLFSLGCVLYRLAAGQAPFVGTDLISTLVAVSTQHPPTPRQLDPSLPAELSDLVMTLLAKEPDRRPPSAQAVIERLDRIPITPAAKPRPRRRRWAAAAAVGLLLAALAGLLASGVFQLKTKDGTIVLEGVPADAKVLVDGETATIEPAGAGGPIVVRVAPGERQLVITAAGFEMMTQDVTLRAGEHKPLRIRLAPLAAPRWATPAVPAAFEEIHGATKAALLAWAAKRPPGVRPVWVAVRTGTKETLFDAVARRDLRAKEWRLRVLTPDEARTDYEDLKKEGFRPALICTYNTTDLGDARIWVKDGRPWANWFGTADFMRNVAKEALENGDPPSSLCVKQFDDGGLLYEMTFDGAHATPWEMHLDLSPDDLARKMAEYRARGWRPHLVNLHHNRTPLRYLAVFVENKTKEAWQLSTGLTPEEFDRELARRKAAGARPRCVCSSEEDGKVGYTVVWDGGPAVGRTAPFLRGNWQIVGDMIEQLDKDRLAMILFGSPEFGDGDFTCEAKRIKGDHGVALVARATDLENYYYFDVGVSKNHYHSLHAKEAGSPRRRIDEKMVDQLPNGWYRLRLCLRGDSFEAYIDDRLVLRGKDDRRRQGYLGLGTWNKAGKFRRLTFTDPLGKVLWEGLPELPAAKE